LKFAEEVTFFGTIMTIVVASIMIEHNVPKIATQGINPTANVFRLLGLPLFYVNLFMLYEY